MCGIIGAYSQNPTEQTHKIIKLLFEESQIRGKHASGIAYVSRGSIKSYNKPISGKEFAKELHYEDSDYPLCLIGHCRYSTSDLAYNQPIFTKDNAIAHNGVVTQMPPGKWAEYYGFNCETKNDSELILQCIEAGLNPEQHFKGASMAVVHIDAYGNLRAWRNGLRPLWECKIGGDYFVASTKDIFLRVLSGAGLQAEPKMIKCSPDYQVYDLECSTYYKKL